jgi:hypothetical protein
MILQAIDNSSCFPIALRKQYSGVYEAQLSATSPDGVIRIRTELRFLVSKSGDAELFHLGQLKPSNLFRNSTPSDNPTQHAMARHV